MTYTEVARKENIGKFYKVKYDDIRFYCTVVSNNNSIKVMISDKNLLVKDKPIRVSNIEECFFREQIMLFNFKPIYNESCLKLEDILKPENIGKYYKVKDTSIVCQVKGYTETNLDLFYEGSTRLLRKDYSLGTLMSFRFDLCNN